MIRWKYVVPRLIILVLVATALWISLGPILRWTLIRGGTHLTQTVVEIGEVNVRIARSQIDLSDLRVVDGQHPTRNLLEAERMLLDVDTQAALRRKLVVRTGRVDGVRFYVDREKAATLPDDQNEADSEASSLADQVGDRGKAWLKSATDRLQEDLENDLRTVQLARELQQRWPREYQLLRQQGRRIEDEGKQLKEQVTSILDDPLQNLHHIQPAVNRIDRLRQDMGNTKTKLTELRQQMRQDRVAIARAKQHDVEYLRQKLHVDALDAQSLNDYLLGPVWSKRIQLALDWIRRSREITGSGSSPTGRQPASRGVSVVFPGFHASPDVLIRQLLLTGSGTAQGEMFSFRAQLADLTHQPRRHSVPTTIRLEADGALRISGRAVMDRRTDVPHDRFLIDVPELNQSAQTLGDLNELAVHLDAGVATIQADVRLEGQDLQGWISFRQPQLKVKPVVSQRYAQFVTPDSLAKFSQIERLDAKMLLGGNLSQPNWQLQSNLGAQLAQVLNAAVRQELVSRQGELAGHGQQLAQEQLDDLERRLTAEHGDLLRSLEIGDRQLQTIRRQLLAAMGSPDRMMGQGKKLLDLIR